LKEQENPMKNYFSSIKDLFLPLFKLNRTSKSNPVKSGQSTDSSSTNPGANNSVPPTGGTNLAFTAAALTDKGLRRENNEDSCLVTGLKGKKGSAHLLLGVVADGMGGQDHGEVASSTAVAVLREEFNHLDIKNDVEHDCEDWLRIAVSKANAAVIEAGSTTKKTGAMGSTMVAVLITGERALIANAGDSRAYILRKKQLSQITKDHSLVSVMAEKGLITPEEIYTHPRRNEIMRFLGQSSEINPDMFELELMPGDVILLCSDGLWGMVRDNELAAKLEAGRNPAETCGVLIEAANTAGGEDNISAVVVWVE
jgi:serine/threonine protein phosphatase PrpC